MKILSWIIRQVKKLCRYLWNHKVLTVLSIPSFIAMFFLMIFFFPGLAKYFGNPDGKGKDYSYASYQADVIHLDQGWGEGYRHQYYYTPQGSQIIPLDIALALEGPDTEQLIFGVGGLAVTKYGYLPYPKTSRSDGKKKYSLNPDGLPVGFTIDGYIEPKYTKTKKNKTPMLGMNCAACHTSDMQINGARVRIDGNQALGDFIGLLTAIDTSLAQTLSDNAKFKRFEARIVENAEGDASLRARLKSTMERREIWQRRNAPDTIPGHGRVDAFGVIFNQVAGNNLHRDTRNLDGNVRAPNAPVSYPVLWNTSHMGHVQWNGSANNKKRGGILGRNFGQVLGVFGHTELTRNNSLIGSCSTVKRRNLNLMDYWLAPLNSPKWSDPALTDLLPELDETLVKKGKDIYEGAGKCASCHAVIPESYRDVPAKKRNACDIPFTMVDVDIVKTDPFTALTGVRDGAKSGPLEGLKSKAREGEYIAPEEPYTNILREAVARSIVGSFQTVSCEGVTDFSSLVDAVAGFGTIAKSRRGKGNQIGDGYDFKPKEEAAYQDTQGDDNEDPVRDPDSECGPDKAQYIYKTDKNTNQNSYHPYAYRARPLNGIWASAPYLHNGSVPTLYDLLLPAAGEAGCIEGQECRPDVFYVGNTEFDPVKVGYVYTEAGGLTRIDTGLRESGNGNGGHNYGLTLSGADKAALLEYLKSL